MIILLFEEDRCKEYKHEYWIFVNINENGSNPYGHLVDMGKKKKLNKLVSLKDFFSSIREKK